MKRKTKITLKTEELILYKTRRCLTGFCPHCNAQVELQTIETANLISDELVEINAVETEKVLVSQNPSGDLLKVKKVSSANF